MTGPGFRPVYGSRLIDAADVLPDTYDDVLGAKILRLQQIDRWTAEKRRLQRDLDIMCPYFGYAGWRADPRDYLIHLVGQSFQYDVPTNKRGRLARFRGVRVRLICLGSGLNTRWIRVGPVNPLDVQAASPDCAFHPEIHARA